MCRGTLRHREDHASGPAAGPRGPPGPMASGTRALARRAAARASRGAALQAGQTLEGSFSAVSTPIFATKCSFCSIFRDLQDITFCTARNSKFYEHFVGILLIFS